MSSIVPNVDSVSALMTKSEGSIGIEWNCEKPRKWDPWLDGEYGKPHIDMPNEVNFIGGLGPNVGHPRSTQHILRPTTIQQIYNMRTRNQPVFTFCEDPRKANNVVLKKERIDHTNVKRIKQTVERVRLAQNIGTPPESDFSEDPTEIFDTDNPLGLDLQGIDRKETFQRDEQHFQNRREYLQQKRTVDKRRLAKQTQIEWQETQINKQFGLPDYFNIEASVAGDENLLHEPAVKKKPAHWTSKYRVPPVANGPRLQRPVPEAIPFSPPATERAPLVRIGDKVANIALEEAYHRRRVERLTALLTRRFEKQRFAEQMADKQRQQAEANRVVDMAEQDFNRHFVDAFGAIQTTYADLPAIYHERKYPHTLRETRRLHKRMNRLRSVIGEEANVRNAFARSQGQPAVHQVKVCPPAPSSPPPPPPPPAMDNDNADDNTLSEQSTDDEDTLSVGQRGDKEYQLRGFHYKMGETMRGLRNVMPQSKRQRAPRTCMTRSEWFDQMAPQRQQPAFYEDNRSSVPNRALPSDPDYDIFAGVRGVPLQPRPIAMAPIRELVVYGRVAGRDGTGNRRAPKIRKPKYLKVRKFNLTAYMFGAQKRLRVGAALDGRRATDGADNKYGVSSVMLRKCDALHLKNKQKHRAMRQNRMRTLGIPIEATSWAQQMEQLAAAKDEDSEESDYDWVPERAAETQPRIDERSNGANQVEIQLRPDEQTSGVNLVNQVRLSAGHDSIAEAPDNKTYNVLQCREAVTRKAPKSQCTFETTAQAHKSTPFSPQVPSTHERSNKVNQVRLSAGHDSFAETHKTSDAADMYEAPQFREPIFRNAPKFQHIFETTAATAKKPTDSTTLPTYDVPRLSKLASDLILSPNLAMPRTEYTNLFGVRHHHPHHDATQHKQVYVKFLPKMPQFRPPPAKKERAARAKPFQRAIFPGTPLREDCALPTVQMASQPIETHTPQSKRTSVAANQSACADLFAAATSTESSAPVRSRQPHERDHTVDTAKQSFIDLLRTRHQHLVSTLGADALPAGEHRLASDQLELMRRLRDEMDSIRSCDSSQTSSVCTNYTNDSGSHLELEGHKVPCDLVNKSMVPFEEIDRCRVVTGPPERRDEYNGPYYAVPFAGQKKDMRQLSLPADRFFTSGSRSRYGIRDRLLVPSVGFDFDRIGIGRGQGRRISHLATEWDAYYQHEIRTRPRIRKFQPRTVMANAREALRMQFESNYIQEAITEQAIVSKLEQRYAAEVIAFRDVCVPLFAQWQETNYRAYMRKMQSVKPFYELTDRLKSELQTLRNAYIRQDLNVIYMEDDWRRRTIMQNFHYLLAETGWRVEHDWIHRAADGGGLENFRTSIGKRAVTNVRVREKDSAWAVKEFYERFFENEEARRVHIVFPNAADFVCGLKKLKIKSFMCLLELHFAMWTLSNLEHAFRSFRSWSDAYVAKRQKFVRGQCAKKYFVEDLAADLQQKAEDLVSEPLQHAVTATALRRLCALCETMFVQLIAPIVRDNMKGGADVVDKFAMIVNKASETLEDLQHIPHEMRLSVERKIRQKNSFVARKSRRACELEQRIKSTTKSMRLSLAPPYKKQPPKHPLPRSYLPKIIPVVPMVKTEITELDKLFYRAFTDQPPQRMEEQSAEDAAILRSLEANCIPFYFDFFLRQHNYFPDYQFKTEIELLDGDEYGRFRYEDVVDDVHRRLVVWEAQKQIRIEQHIQQTWHLYRPSIDDNAQ